MTVFPQRLRVPLCAVCLLLGAAAASAAPRITCDAPVRNFGVVHSNTQHLSHVFILRNTGDETLHIAAIKSSCGCTTAQPERKDIEPGDRISLRAAFDPSGRKGSQHKSITILSNDPSTPEFILEVKCDIQLAMNVEPPSLFFGQINRDATQQRTARLEAASNFTFRVLGVDTSRLSMTSVRLDTIETGRVYALVATITPGAIVSNGFIRERLIVTTDMPGFTTVDIPVFALVTDEVRMNPSAILVNTRSLAVEPIQRELYLQAVKDRGWAIAAVEAEGNFTLTAEVIDKNRVRVAIKGLKPESSLPAKRIRVRVRAADGTERVLTIPFQHYDSKAPRGR